MALYILNIVISGMWNIRFTLRPPYSGKDFPLPFGWETECDPRPVRTLMGRREVYFLVLGMATQFSGP